MILAEGMRPIVAGILLGCGLGAVFARFLASILFQVQPDESEQFCSLNDFDRGGCRGSLSTTSVVSGTGRSGGHASR